MAQADGSPDGRIERILAELAAAQARTQTQIEALAVHMERAAAQIEALTIRMDRVEVRMERVEAQIEALTVRMDRVEAQIEALTVRMDRVEAQIEALAVRMDRVEAQIEALAVRMERVEAQIERLVEVVMQLGDRVGHMRGTLLEIEYRTKAPAYFGRLVRRAHAVSHEELDAVLESAVERGVLSLEEKQDLIEVDLVVQGRREDAEVHLAVEVSGVIDPHDVQRAARRASVLAKVVGQVVPVVAGDGVAPRATREAENLGVWQLLDGKVLRPTA